MNINSVLEGYFSFVTLPFSYRYGQLQQNMVGILSVAKSLVESVIEALNTGYIIEEGTNEKIPVSKEQIIDFFLQSGAGSTQFNKIEKIIGEVLQRGADVNKILENINNWINISATKDINNIDLINMLTMTPQEVFSNIEQYRSKQPEVQEVKTPKYTGPERRKVKRSSLDTNSFTDTFYRVSNIIKQYRYSSKNNIRHILAELQDENIDDVIEVFDIYSDNISETGKLNGFVTRSLRAFKQKELENVKLSNYSEPEIKISNQI